MLKTCKLNYYFIATYTRTTLTVSVCSFVLFSFLHHHHQYSLVAVEDNVLCDLCKRRSAVIRVCLRHSAARKNSQGRLLEIAESRFSPAAADDRDDLRSTYTHSRRTSTAIIIVIVVIFAFTIVVLTARSSRQRGT